jgi:hypothetical protein
MFISVHITKCHRTPVLDQDLTRQMLGYNKYRLIGRKVEGKSKESRVKVAIRSR